MIPPPPRSTLFPYTTLFRSTRKLIVVMARSFRSRCFNLLIFIKMSLCFYRRSSRQDADCFAALDINNVEQTPVYRHPDDGFSRLALDNAQREELGRRTLRKLFRRK